MTKIISIIAGVLASIGAIVIGLLKGKVKKVEAKNEKLEAEVATVTKVAEIQQKASERIVEQVEAERKIDEVTQEAVTEVVQGNTDVMLEQLRKWNEKV